MQVYRDLAIITARPTPAEEALAPHRLYGCVDAAENFSVGRWLERAGAALAEVREAGRLPVLVGGTGLYFRALTSGMAPIPPVPDAVREAVRREAADLAPQVLHARLAARDPETAGRLRPSDPQRILRALEVLEATGLPLAEWQRAAPSPALLAPGAIAGVFLSVDRAALRLTIDRRFEAMMTAGALEEVARLASRRLDPALPAMRAHGVPGLIAHLEGHASLDEAIARGQRDTRAYAKRQETWFRNQMPDFQWLSPAEAGTRLAARLQT